MDHNFNLHLTEDEEIGIILSDHSITDPLANYGLPLVGKVATMRLYSLMTLKANLLILLQPIKGMEVTMVSESRFIIRFQHPLDRKNALLGYPWLLDKKALVLSEIPEDIDPSLVNLDWIFIFFCGYNHAGSYLRLKVRLNINSHLKKGTFIRSPIGSSVWVNFVYELLPNFCFLCEFIGHLERKCPKNYEDNFEDPGDNFAYGPWLAVTANTRFEYNGGFRIPVQPIISP
ncbi:hypothetical protein CDL12_09481 [Handroanthus impetiginosus]|uniref:Zinc knuckle CX2CX4HX4C domain-containing protein n=1 Tax=Handroanthus impetiginosus TaxID=429701 RepID=A0A2G9HK19_9LAMI|nr:hypothetical protein CDL12_09481 [Handroanthus impetiginosus]